VAGWAANFSIITLAARPTGLLPKQIGHGHQRRKRHGHGVNVAEAAKAFGPVIH
jgi:hypothetical protein